MNINDVEKIIMFDKEEMILPEYNNIVNFFLSATNPIYQYNFSYLKEYEGFIEKYSKILIKKNKFLLNLMDELINSGIIKRILVLNSLKGNRQILSIKILVDKIWKINLLDGQCSIYSTNLNAITTEKLGYICEVYQGDEKIAEDHSINLNVNDLNSIVDEILSFLNETVKELGE